MKHCLFIFLVISTIGTSSISAPSIHQKDLTLSQMEAELISEYKLMTEIEENGVDISNMMKGFNDILSMFSEAKYYESINNEEKLGDIKEVLYEKNSKLENELNDIYQKSVLDYDLYKKNLLYKTILLDLLSVILVIVLWNFIIRLYFNKIMKYKVVIKK